ncbi:MAG: hypothetical protein IPK46_08920 [Saprospiraceae bacterium]|nr:hypothetical protein [Saprospiraceae bacterium]
MIHRLQPVETIGRIVDLNVDHAAYLAGLPFSKRNYNVGPPSGVIEIDYPSGRIHPGPLQIPPEGDAVN